MVALRKPVEIAKDMNHQKQRTAAEIEKRTVDFTSMLRETFGDRLNRKELIICPKLAGREYDIAVGAKTEDSAEEHRTIALMDITSSTGHKTQLFVKASEPTRAGGRIGLGKAERRAQVSVVDPSEPDSRYDSRDYNHAELSELKEVTMQVMDDVSAACDRGYVEVFERGDGLHRVA